MFRVCVQLHGRELQGRWQIDAERENEFHAKGVSGFITLLRHSICFSAMCPSLAFVLIERRSKISDNTNIILWDQLRPWEFLKNSSTTTQKSYKSKVFISLVHSVRIARQFYTQLIAHTPSARRPLKNIKNKNKCRQASPKTRSSGLVACVQIRHHDTKRESERTARCIM